MKLPIRQFLLAATLAAFTQISAAERWSSDETAVRMGLNVWFALWTRPASDTESPLVKTLYATEPSPRLPAVVQAVSRSGAVPSAVNQPERFAVSVQGDRAVTSFPLPAGINETPTQVVLTWERRAGVWRIVQESITPPPQPAERVALSDQATAK